MSKVRLDDIVDTCLGKMLDKEKNRGEYHPYLANANVQWGQFKLDNLPLMKFEEHEHERYGLQYGDLVICEGGEPGRCAIWRNEISNMKIQKALHRVRAKENKVLDIRYLYYWFCLAGKIKLLDRYFIETTIKHLPGDRLKDLQIELPNINKQKNIADILEILDQKIQNNNKIIAELESMAKTIYDYWFVQFDFPNENGKPYRTSGGKMEYNAELKREIPVGWEVKNAKELLDVVTGKEDANFATQNGKYKFFTCSQEPLHCDEYSFIGNAVLIAGNGDFNVKHYTGKFNAYQRTYVLIPNDKKYYASLYIVAKDLITRFKSNSNGSIVKFITKGDVESITLLVPDTDELYEKLNSIIFSQEQKQQENQELTALRDWLLPMLMNGQAVVE